MRKQVAAFTLVLAMGFGFPASALVIIGGSGANSADPGAGLPWSNVGNVNGASGVYLGNYGGNYWALTASHVVASGANLGNLVLNSVTYNFVPGSGVVVQNGDTSLTDLTLFRISSDPGLANLALSTSAPATNSTLVYVGRGGIEGSVNYWVRTVNAGPSDDVWVDQFGVSAGANSAGYLLTGGLGERWGQSWMAGTSSYNIGTGDTAAIFTLFTDNIGDTMAAGGDSGGATFYQNGPSWELAGIMGAISTFENQPGGTAVLGNLTFSASIASYNGFITSAIPEPAQLGVSVAAGLFAMAAALRKKRAR